MRDSPVIHATKLLKTKELPGGPETRSDSRKEALLAVVNSPVFQRAARLREFLLFIGTCTLEGRERDVTEHQIGIHVFGKDATFNPAEDNIVRASARMLRVKLREYFDAEGASLRRAFLHAPLNFRRISSGFTNRRFHPILRIWRPHHGTDYAAATGTPAVAVGDGVVFARGYEGGLGNVVKVRHNGTYSTYYGHLSRFAKGVNVGTRVRQGQVIGYVGSTGLSTGPHLHFEMIKNGTSVNFLTLKVPSVGSVPAERKRAFDEKRDKVLAPLEKQLPPPENPA